MSQRYYVSQPIEADRLLLDGAEAHHLLHVMRAKPGHEIVLFDGHGAEFLARVERCGRADVECTVLSQKDTNRELAFQLTLAVALPKGDRQRWLVEKVVEMGVGRLIPLVTERSVARPTGSTIQRLGRTVIEASKQCGRNVLMQIAEPIAWEALVQTEAGHRLIAHPGGEPMAAIQWTGANSVTLAVGPEGGFTGEEVTAAKNAGWQVVDLGPRILRVETAALVFAAILSHRF